MPTDTALTALTEALRRRSLALFIGADLPREVTGLPSRADLAADLALRYSLDERLPLADVAARVSQAGNRFEFTQFLREALDTTGKPPQPFHRRIAALIKEHTIATIITVAYDNLLELAFQAAGIGINRVVRGADVSFLGSDRSTLFKLYGDVMQPDTLIVTDRDHTGLLRDREREPLLDEVRQALRRNTVLFLGYNLADPDFRFLFDQVAESRFARTAYAVWPGLAEADVRMWRDRGIAILAADPLGVLAGAAAPAAAVPQSPQTVAIPSRAGPKWNTAAFRNLLTAAFNDEDLKTLCFDNFPDVSEQFTTGMTKGQMIQLLLDYCTRQEQMDVLLAAVQKANPAQYRRYEGSLRG